MKIHYCGSFVGKEYPKRESVEGATLINFKDIGFLFKSPGWFLLYMPADILISCITDYPFYIRFGIYLTTWLFIPVHEILHGMWFKEDSYVYRVPRQGFIITSTEVLSKLHFLVMVLFPSLVLGICPIALSFFYPEMKYLFAFGAYTLSCCVSDFNIIFAVAKQVPPKAKVFLSGGNTYFYIPN